MAHPNSQLDAVKNPQTRCSNCQTVFEVSRELLSSSDTRVRCGECLSIFDALDEIRSGRDLGDYQADTGSSSQAYGSGEDTAALDVTYSDFDLFSAEADLPEIAYFDQTRDTPDFDFDAFEISNDETFSDTLFVHDVTIDADATTLRAKPAPTPQNGAAPFAEIGFVADEQPREPLIFNYRDNDEPVGDTTNNLANTGLSERVKPSAEASSVASLQGSAKESNQDLPNVSLDAARDVSVDSKQEAISGVVNGKGLNADSTPNASTASSFSLDEDVLGSFDAQSATERQAVELEAKKGASPWLFRIAMLGLLVVLLGGLFAQRVQPQLYNSPTLRPVLVAGCKLFGCSIPARVDVASLKMVKRNVFSHPSTPNELVINVSFRNDAEFAQQLPRLHLVLSNRVGRTVANQYFSPPEYFQNWSKDAVIESKEQLDVKLEISDPGQDAQSFEFYFREHKQ